MRREQELSPKTSPLKGSFGPSDGQDLGLPLRGGPCCSGRAASGAAGQILSGNRDSDSSSTENVGFVFSPFFLNGKRTINNEPPLVQGEIRPTSQGARSSRTSVTGHLAQPGAFPRSAQRAHEVLPAPPRHPPAQGAYGRPDPLANTGTVPWSRPRLCCSQVEPGRELIAEFTERGKIGGDSGNSPTAWHEAASRAGYCLPAHGMGDASGKPSDLLGEG